MIPYLPIPTAYDPRRLKNTQLSYGDKNYEETLWVKFSTPTKWNIMRYINSWICSTPNSYLLYLPLGDIVHYPPHLSFIYEVGIDVR